MSTMNPISGGTMLVLLVFAIFQICHAGAGSGLDLMPVRSSDNSHPDGLQIDFNLGNGKVYNTMSYRDALAFLEELKGASSCRRLAAHTLINACQAADNTASLDLALAEIKEEYAVKLAACELDTVRGKGKDAIPKVCKIFLPTKEACPKTRSESAKSCYAPATRAQVATCISALHERAQLWTSYSNSLQNVQDTCQASRLAIDRDQMLDQIKIALQTAADASRTTQEAMNHIHTQARADIVQLQQLQQANQIAVERDIKNMVDDVTQYGRHTLFSMFAEVAKLYQNWTSTASRQADTIIETNELILQTATQLQTSMSGSLDSAAALSDDHKVLAQQVAANSQMINTLTELVIHNKEQMTDAITQHLDQMEAASQLFANVTQVALELSVQAQGISAALAPVSTIIHRLTAINWHNMLISSGLVYIFCGRKLALSPLLATFGVLGLIMTLPASYILRLAQLPSVFTFLPSSPIERLGTIIICSCMLYMAYHYLADTRAKVKNDPEMATPEMTRPVA